MARVTLQTIAEELGLAVPRDLSVVGFDDSPLARRVRSGRRHRASQVLLPTELVVRESTGPAGAGADADG